MGSRLRSSTRASTIASESLADTESKPVKGDTKKTTAAKPLKSSEMARIRKLIILAFFVSFAFMGAFYYAAYTDKLKLYPRTITTETLKGFAARAEFALRYQTLQLSWLMFNVLAVIYVRVTTKAINPLVDSTEKNVNSINRILNNSFEQVILSVLLQLVFCTFADPSLTLKLIPAINVVQFIGRVTFFAGYPLYRTFGFNLSNSTNMMMLIYNMYRFSHQFL